VADKVKEEILVYDSLAHNNKHHFYGVKKLIDRMKTKKGNGVVEMQQLRDKEFFQRQHDGVNCGYFTCWYAHQVVTNQPVAGWSGNYHKEVQKVRENIMCSLVQNAIVAEETKHIVWNN
jgi:Ulp1 family protease